MTTSQLIAKILKGLVWPPKGIIYIEAYLLAWVYGFARAYLIHYGSVLLIVLAIIMAISTTIGTPPGHLRRSIWRFVRNVLMQLLVICFRVLTAWIYLCIGIFNGRMANTHQPPTLRVHAGGPHLRFVWDTNHLAWHYRFGRWLYRRFNNLLSRIPNINSRFASLSAILARVICAILVLWNIWDLPRFIFTWLPLPPIHFVGERFLYKFFLQFKLNCCIIYPVLFLLSLLK